MSPTTEKQNPSNREARIYPNKPPPGKEDIIQIPFWAKISTFINTHQNLLFFILLSVCLVAGLLWWRHYRLDKMTQEASYKLEKSDNAEELKGMLQNYGMTPVAPLIRYKLANIYLNENKFDEAKKEYDYILEKFPKHPITEQVTQLLNQLKVNEEWAKGELNKQLAEISQKRNLPRLTIMTAKGDLEIELYEDDAPNTVANFISIIQANVYSPTAVYEIRPDLGVCLGRKEPLDYAISFEENQIKHKEGVLGMIRDTDVSSGKPMPSDSYRFYIYTSDKENEELDGKYTIFGRVVKGMPVVRMLTKDDAITSVVINFKRLHEYKADKVNIEKSSTPITPAGTEPPKKLPF
ncbi:MAG: peptidylprolyl isomerase [Planctomycetes bacterium]|nr:peptidylprolyl isomerase [Planctomycetota bacterium]